MKRPKDRLHRVIVIGATPAGIAATNKLGELGIPVILIDSDIDLDKKLSDPQWKLKSGISFNHAHRPGLLRILRNPDISCIMPAEITSIKHSSQGFRVNIKRLQTFVDPKKCTLCGRCVEACIVKDSQGNKAVQFNSRRSIPGRVSIGKLRKPLCQENCPLGVNVQGYMALTKEGKFDEALDLIRKENVLPGICGRICTHPCEANCRRNEIDEPLSIRDIKRFLADHGKNFNLKNQDLKANDFKSSDIDKNIKKIAIIGSGPAGLACAADLCRYGASVTIFEKEKLAGGMLRYGIGSHRLPRSILEAELEFIKKLGVNIVTSYPVDLEKDLQKLQKDFDGIILTTGTWSDRKLSIPGEDMEGIYGCVSFLKHFYNNENLRLNDKVAVIGDGNAAFDLARVLIRIGADVTIISWFSEDMIPADKEEIRLAKKEGIKIKDNSQVIEFIGENGKLKVLRCMPTKPGETDDKGIRWPVIDSSKLPLDLSFDKAFVAVGQAGSFNTDKTKFSFDTTEKGLIKIDDNCRTNIPGIYAAGDTVSGPSSVVNAMASGRMAAKTVYQDIKKTDFKDDYFNTPKRPEGVDFAPIPSDIPSMSRQTMPERQVIARKGCFDEVCLGFNETQAIAESKRCLQCGGCSQCMQCLEACSAIGAIDHSQTFEEIVEHAGVLIIADPQKVQEIKGDDVIRAYAPSIAKSDIYAMILRGYAAAASSMVLLGETSKRPKGHGLSFTPPDPGLSPEIKIGVFICKCNDSFGWLDELSKYANGLNNKDNVVHVEEINAACLKESNSLILRTIREKGITRLVLASCVCCPLNFVCSACTDQRNRLKNSLFSGTGISRSMVETCNIRGEALRFIKHEPALAIERFSGLIDRSIYRAKRLKSIPAVARNYNFATAVIGESEATISSALTLANFGLDVLLFGNLDNADDKDILHPNIHYFKESSVTGISGTLGDFQIYTKSGGNSKIVQAGAVIIDEKSRKNIPYIPQEGLPIKTIGSYIPKDNIKGMPFFHPGKTSISGLFLASPSGINISERQKGAASAAHAACVMPRGPRQSRGFTVVIDSGLCRGCGRCYHACQYQAITFNKNSVNGFYAVVDEALCKGCGNCISVCPSNAADSPYRDQAYLEDAVNDLLKSK